MIAMLGCSEVNIEILDASMETIESNNCRKVSRDDKCYKLKSLELDK